MKTAAEEIRESIAELEKESAAAKERLVELDKRIYVLKSVAFREPERIRVPENIKFEEFYGGFALVSPNGKCILYGSAIHGGIPKIEHAGHSNNSEFRIITDPLYLEPCKREDLKCGDWALPLISNHRVGDIMANAKHVGNYNCILNDIDTVEWQREMDTAINSDKFNYWYKVVR
jgi:hypothetical protein